jgi:hypothetical protein
MHLNLGRSFSVDKSSSHLMLTGTISVTQQASSTSNLHFQFKKYHFKNIAVLLAFESVWNSSIANNCSRHMILTAMISLEDWRSLDLVSLSASWKYFYGITIRDSQHICHSYTPWERTLTDVLSHTMMHHLASNIWARLYEPLRQCIFNEESIAQGLRKCEDDGDMASKALKIGSWDTLRGGLRYLP